MRGLAVPILAGFALAGCGGEDGREQAAGSPPLAARCEAAAFRAALAQETSGPVRVTRVRCAGDLAVTRAVLGETRPLILWRRGDKGWRRAADGSSDRCRELVGADPAARLCGAPSKTERADTAACQARAFTEAIRRSITRGSAQIRRMRCADGRATTVVDLGDCPPEATAEIRRRCQRLATAHWERRDGRWVLQRLTGAG